jgi:hypothetical protein
MKRQIAEQAQAAAPSAAPSAAAGAPGDKNYAYGW